MRFVAALTAVSVRRNDIAGPLVTKVGSGQVISRNV